MTGLAGFWVICLALTILILGIEISMDFKTKVKTGILFMSFLTLLMIGVLLLAV